MAHLAVNEKITSGRALAPGQILQLGSFTMGTRSAVKPKPVPQTTKNHLCISLEHSDKMDLADVSSLNELLDRIAAVGVMTDYDWIGLKPDQRDIKSPPITHLVAVVDEQAKG